MDVEEVSVQAGGVRDRSRAPGSINGILTVLRAAEWSLADQSSAGELPLVEHLVEHLEAT